MAPSKTRTSGMQASKAILDLPMAPGAKPSKVSNLADLEKRLKALKKKNKTSGQKAACTRMGTTLANLINESNALGKKAQEIEKKIDALALKIAKDGDVCSSDKK